ncbi:amine oxidase [Plakobranchus ocellatus]|uniref:Amine oxidase n=1 Tax=Plakobranchus ocellatus TaxID=259542 RepID=A0AAV4C0N8_9GAST|nr:amine oxidase [Plakobranchus ocellatus]
MAIANLEKPNARIYSHLIGIAYVKDIHENLKIFMEDINSQMEQLRATQRNGRETIVFLHGDYDFLCKVYGLYSPQGTYPCLWCLTTKRRIQENTERSPCSLALFKSHFERHKTETEQDKRQASQYNNCKHEPLISIELEKISPPYLHILLGIVLKHHRLWEQAADNIDLKIYNDGSPCKSGNSHLPCDYGRNWKKFFEKKKEIAFLEGCVAFERTGSSHQSYAEKLESRQDELETITHAQLTSRSGPVCSKLDSML